MEWTGMNLKWNWDSDERMDIVYRMDQKLDDLPHTKFEYILVTTHPLYSMLLLAL